MVLVVRNSLVKVVNTARSHWLAVCAFCVASVYAAAPSIAMATESEGEKEVKKVTEGVATEGVVIIIAVLGGLVTLIALSIVLPKAIGFIKRFI
jgi:hypothetical protein